MKICIKCGVLKELSDYEKYSGCSNGYRNQCKLCRKESRKKAIYDNIDISIIKVCSKCNEEKQLSDFVTNKNQSSGYRTYCKECANIGSRKSWHKVKNENVEKFKLRRKKYKEKYKLKEENRQKEKERYRTYGSKEETKQKRRKSFNKRYYSNEILRFKLKIKSMINRTFKELGFNRKEQTEFILGCKYEEFKIYIESKFEEWMSWDKHGLYTGNYNETWQIDHIIPISNATTEEEIIKLNHYTNLRPLCSRKNLEKSNQFVFV